MSPVTDLPKAIFFDLDETLVENKTPIPELFAQMYMDFEHQLGVENKELFFTGLRSKISTLWGTMFDGDISPEELFINCFDHSISGIDAIGSAQRASLARDMFNRFTHLSSNNVVLHDGALETLATLSKRGFITGLITNGIEQVQLGKIHQLGLHEKVDHVNVSAQARAHKPYAPVFEMALSKAGVAANHAWQIGDHATNDVAGAIRVGMSGVFFNPKEHDVETAFGELDERPNHVIGHLLEILDLTETN